MFLAMGEVLRDGFNLALSSPSDSRGSEARICIVAIKDKNMGFLLLGNVVISKFSYAHARSW